MLIWMSGEWSNVPWTRFRSWCWWTLSEKYGRWEDDLPSATHSTFPLSWGSFCFVLLLLLSIEEIALPILLLFFQFIKSLLSLFVHPSNSHQSIIKQRCKSMVLETFPKIKNYRKTNGCVLCACLPTSNPSRNAVCAANWSTQRTTQMSLTTRKSSTKLAWRCELLFFFSASIPDAELVYCCLVVLLSSTGVMPATTSQRPYQIYWGNQRYQARIVVWSWTRKARCVVWSCWWWSGGSDSHILVIVGYSDGTFRDVRLFHCPKARTSFLPSSFFCLDPCQAFPLTNSNCFPETF